MVSLASPSLRVKEEEPEDLSRRTREVASQTEGGGHADILQGFTHHQVGEGAGGERGGVVAVNQLYIVGLGKVNGEGMQ